ncbi:MAG: hypothetical protein M1470_11035 [Bacteroidetes bacterium]|nr:hypothetical protein [Bacteroidota bacterium]MCL5738987.1 hypothetical protein [Bacteroidota bacterium]
MKKTLFVLSLSLLIAACQKADNVIIDSSQPINVQLTYFDKDSIDIARYISNTSTKPTISDSFQVVLSSTQNFAYLDVKVENDSGMTLNDVSYSTAAGRLVSGTITTAFSNVYVGDITYTFTAYNKQASPGDFAIKLVRLFNSKNQAPVIDSVSVPDSVQIDPTSNVVFNLYAFVHDAAGLSNIAKVYFNTTKPDGTPSSGNPFMMYDDGGASGAPGDDDAVANNGTYTLAIQLPPGTAIGTYGFTFYAVDRSGLSSTPISRNIKVYK